MSSEQEHYFGQLQMHSQQLQNIMMQKQALSMRSRELEKAIEEAKDSTEIYRTIGPILVKVEKNKIEKELEEEKEEIDIKLKSLESQEDRIKSKIKDAQEKVQSGSSVGG